MKRQSGLSLPIFFLLIFCNSLSAKYLYVADNGSNADGQTWETAFTTIQAAILAAGEDPNVTTILVGSAQTGHGSGFYKENISVSLPYLTIESESGPLQTTIQANSSSIHTVSISASGITFRGFRIYGSTWTNIAAIALSDADSCIIENNHCGWDGTHRNFQGIHLFNASNNRIQNNLCSSNTGTGILISAGGGNLLLENTLEANGGPAIEITNSSSRNTLRKNRCNGHTANPAIRLAASSYNVITQNVCSANSIGLALTNEANYNSITANRFENNDLYGIQLQANSNQILANISRQNYYGIYCYESQFNTLCQNLFEDNSITSFVYYRNSEGDRWNSPIPFTYLYADAIFSSKMGNYYSTYSGTDLNNDGIGETPYSLYGTFAQDYFPLTDPQLNYRVQSWYLSGGGTMSMEPNQPGQWETIPAESSILWVSDTSAVGPIDFDVLSDQDGWSGQILFSTSVNGSAFEIEIGYTDPTEGLFISGGPSAFLSNTQNLFQFKTSPQSFRLPAGNVLAVRIRNHSTTSRQLFTGGGWTHITPPAGTLEIWPGTPPQPHSSNPADLNNDGWVTLHDLAYLSAYWGMDSCDNLNDYCQSADINQSGIVDITDLELLAEFWLMGPDDYLPGDWNEDFRVNMDDIALLSAKWNGDLEALIVLCENWLKGAF